MRLEPLAALALCASSVSGAATLIVDPSGELTGASGVNVGGTLYDVSFVGGTCADAFGVCDSAHFDFTTASDALAASQALMDQVFIDGPDGQFDSQPSLTIGCSNWAHCTALTPYDTGTVLACAPYAPCVVPVVYAGWAQNIDITGNGGVTSDNARVSSINRDAPSDYPDQFIWARWTSSPSSVPEPSTWAMMLFGFGALGFQMRCARMSSATPNLQKTA